MNKITKVGIGGGVLFGGLVCGCTAPRAPLPTPAVSYDGRYQTTVEFVSGDPRMCATEPHVLLQVTNNQFTYAQPHPNIAGTSPTLTRQATTSTYVAAIDPQGNISGTSDLNGSISGHIDGTHMTGRLVGLLCSYSFDADRM